MQFKRKITHTLIASLLVGGNALAVSSVAHANDSDELEQLRALVQELDQKVKILARKTEINEEDAAAAKKSTPVVKASKDGFGFESADGKSVIKFNGLAQYDYRSFDEGAAEVRNRSDSRGGSLSEIDGFKDAANSWVARRIRPTLQGTLYGKYDFRFTPEFAGGGASIVDAYIDARLKPYAKVRVGKYKPFVGLERLQGGGDIKFIERSYVSNDILPNRDQGISLYGDVFGDKLNYAFGLNNGVVDGGNAPTTVENDGGIEYTARLFTTPFKDDVNALSGLGFGIAATYTDYTAEKNLNFTDTTAADGTRNGLPAYVTNAQQVFFRYSPAVIADGKRVRVSPQAYYYYGSFGLLAEYAIESQDVSLASGSSPAAGGTGATALATAQTTILNGSKKKLTHDAWQIAGTYLLTGEDSSFKSVKPKADFDLDKGTWGAWELALRYSQIDLDSDTFKAPNGSGYAAQTGADATPTLAQSYADPTLSAKKAKSWTAGVNWYLTQNTKIVLNYEQTSFDGGAITGPAFNTATGASNGYLAGNAARQIKDRPDERSLFARFQYSF